MALAKSIPDVLMLLHALIVSTGMLSELLDFQLSLISLLDITYDVGVWTSCHSSNSMQYLSVSETVCITINNLTLYSQGQPPPPPSPPLGGYHVDIFTAFSYLWIHTHILNTAILTVTTRVMLTHLYTSLIDAVGAPCLFQSTLVL